MWNLVIFERLLVSQVISGQKSGKNHSNKCGIYIWNLETLDTIDVLEFGQNESGIFSVAFSNNSSADSILFVSVIQDLKSNYLSIWDYSLKSKKFQQSAKVSTESKDSSRCSFHPLDNHLVCIVFLTAEGSSWNSFYHPTPHPPSQF